jgi:hypothetical protein
MLEWALCGFHKKRSGTRFAELVFLHLVGSVGHVVNPMCLGHGSKKYLHGSKKVWIMHEKDGL